MEGFKLVEILGEYTSVYKLYVNNSDIGGVYITKSPLSNCQTYCLGGINNIIYIYRDDSLEILKEIFLRVEKKQMLIDISEKWFQKFENLIKKENFIFSTPYVNSTGSNMVMCLVNMYRLFIKKGYLYTLFFSFSHFYQN